MKILFIFHCVPISLERTAKNKQDIKTAKQRDIPDKKCELQLQTHHINTYLSILQAYFLTLA